MDSELEYGEYPFKLSLHKYDLKTYKSLIMFCAKERN